MTAPDVRVRRPCLVCGEPCVTDGPAGWYHAPEAWDAGDHAAEVEVFLVARNRTQNRHALTFYLRRLVPAVEWSTDAADGLEFPVAVAAAEAAGYLPGSRVIPVRR